MKGIVRKFVPMALIISIALLQSGCSMFAGSRQPFSVTCNEPSAQIFINGELIGTGNVSTTVPRNRGVSVMAKKDGYYSTTRDIGTQMSMLGILDIIGGCIWLIPFIGLATPGARELDQTNVSLILNKEAK